MGRAIRDFDWSQTPLGPIEQWSTALLSAVRILLGQRHAACMFWGPELTMLYNDAFAPALGQKECRALGQPFRVIWADVWDDVAPLVEYTVGEGRVRALGSLLTFPTTGYYHPFGLSSYGVTDIGYTLARNMLTWANPAQSATPDLTDDAIEWVDSEIPTRVMIDGSNDVFAFGQ